MELDSVQQAAREQFARQSHRYGRGHILENVADIEEALRGAQLPADSRALDVATGGGHTGIYLASLGYRVTLADIAGPMLQRAAELASQRGFTVDTRQHPAEEMPYSDATFDLVTCRVAPHHFSSPERFVGESARVLQPRGYFLLIDGTVTDGEPEAEEWMHQVEKFRDPSHNRFLTPQTWSRLCLQHGLAVERCSVTPFKQPDLDWYFETAATSAENRAQVLSLVQNAPATARSLFRLGIEEGRIVWWWQRLALLARKN